MGGACGKRAAAPASRYTFQDGFDALQRQNAVAESLPDIIENFEEHKDACQLNRDELPGPSEPTEEAICSPCESAPAVEDNVRKCKACEQPCVNLHLCGLCKEAEYCSAACERRGWIEHKALCRSKSRRAASQTESIAPVVRVQYVPPSIRQDAECHHCGALCETVLPCVLCRSAMYCSSACQSQAWRGHQAHCKRKKLQTSSSSVSALASDELESDVSARSQRLLQADGVEPANVAKDALDYEISAGSQQLLQGDGVVATTAEEASEEMALRFTTESQVDSSSCNLSQAGNGLVAKDGFHDDCVVEFFKHVSWPHYASDALSDGHVEEFFRHAEWPHYSA
eukprot:TRINITY_DN13635_c0_g1_i1.p1 TRINITY_DN13635_c0_g1~~TRINITY_DN13635_c0_g1_i1.p1  ORF type:complete len:341 (-),score=45.58 TRINITY_DN13635_c0_g1_i1:255-1277(-)